MPITPVSSSTTVGNLPPQTPSIQNPTSTRSLGTDSQSISTDNARARVVPGDQNVQVPGSSSIGRIIRGARNNNNINANNAALSVMTQNAGALNAMPPTGLSASLRPSAPPMEPSTGHVDGPASLTSGGADLSDRPNNAPPTYDQPYTVFENIPTSRPLGSYERALSAPSGPPNAMPPTGLSASLRPSAPPMEPSTGHVDGPASLTSGGADLSDRPNNAPPTYDQPYTVFENIPTSRPLGSYERALSAPSGPPNAMPPTGLSASLRPSAPPMEPSTGHVDGPASLTSGGADLSDRPNNAPPTYDQPYTVFENIPTSRPLGSYERALSAPSGPPPAYVENSVGSRLFRPDQHSEPPPPYPAALLNFRVF